MEKDLYLTPQFLQAAAKPRTEKVIIWTYCEKCMVRKDFSLVRETQNTEIYHCQDCGNEKEYTVR